MKIWNSLENSHVKVICRCTGECGRWHVGTICRAGVGWYKVDEAKLLKDTPRCVDCVPMTLSGH